VQIDGQDVGAVYRATVEARERALSGGGPSFIEMVTYRYHGHQTNEVVNYRTGEELEEWREQRDPIERLRRALADKELLAPDLYDELVENARKVVLDAIHFAEESPTPDPATAGDRVTAPLESKGN